MNNQKERNVIAVNAVTIGEAVNAYNKNQNNNHLPTNFGDFEEVPNNTNPNVTRKEVMGKSVDGKYTFVITTNSSYVNHHTPVSYPASNLLDIRLDFKMPSFRDDSKDDSELTCMDIIVGIFKNEDDGSKSSVYSIHYPLHESLNLYGINRTTPTYRRDTITTNFQNLNIVEQVFVKRSIDIIENFIKTEVQKASILNDINKQNQTNTNSLNEFNFTTTENLLMTKEFCGESFEDFMKKVRDNWCVDDSDEEDENECDCDGNCANCYHNDYDDDEDEDDSDVEDEDEPSNDNDYGIKMDGKYHEFEGGAIRYTKDGKGRFDLITSNTASVIARKLIDYAKEELEWVICKSSIIKDVYDDIDWFQNIGKLSTQASLYTNLVDAIIKLMIMHYEQHEVDLYDTPHNFAYHRSDDVSALNSLLNDLAHHYEKGAKKYGERNCEKGIPLSSFIDSGRRHMYQYFAGMTDENHFIATIWNFWMAAHTILATPIDYSRNTDDVNNKSESAESNESDDAFIRLLLNLLSKRDNNESDDESMDEDE